MIDSFYPKKSQPILFLFLYTSHLFIRSWRPLLAFYVLWTMIDTCILSIQFIPFVSSSSSMLIFLKSIHLVMVVLSILAWYAVLYQIKYFSDFRKTNYKLTAQFIFKKILPLLIFTGLCFAAIAAASLLLIVPGIYVALPITLFSTTLFFIQNKSMCSAIIESVRLVRGEWFSVFFIAIFPFFVTFALIAVLDQLFSFHLSSVFLTYLLFSSFKNMFFLPFIACLILMLTHNQLLTHEDTPLNSLNSLNNTTT